MYRRALPSPVSSRGVRARKAAAVIIHRQDGRDGLRALPPPPAWRSAPPGLQRRSAFLLLLAALPPPPGGRRQPLVARGGRKGSPGRRLLLAAGASSRRPAPPAGAGGTGMGMGMEGGREESPAPALKDTAPSAGLPWPLSPCPHAVPLSPRCPSRTGGGDGCGGCWQTRPGQPCPGVLPTGRTGLCTLTAPRTPRSSPRAEGLRKAPCAGGSPSTARTLSSRSLWLLQSSHFPLANGIPTVTQFQ